MKVIEYLKEHGLDKLSDEYPIIVKRYENLIVLNYRQTYSKKDRSLKFNEIVTECRGLILDNDFNVISRSFDRFFNFNELSPEQQERFKDPSYFKTLKVYEKIDGSLIKIYNFRDWWYISTRKTAFAEFNVGNTSDIRTTTFKDLVFEALNVTDDYSFQKLCNANFEKDRTYIFELTSPQNKIVTPYENECILWLLATRRNDGLIEFPDHLKNFIHDIETPPIYTFSSIEECLESVENLPNLKEGYVVCDESNNPVLKVKSKSYLKLHRHAANDGEKENGKLNPKRIIRLIATGEHEEYLSYFPEKKIEFEPYFDRIDKYLERADKIYKKIYNECKKNDKEFALKINSFAMKIKCAAFSFLAFLAKKQKISFTTTFHELKSHYKEQFISNCIFKPLMIICVGISSSGKSKRAKELSEIFDFVEINRDDIRFSSDLFPGVTGWKDYKFNSKNELKVTEKCLEIWERANLERKDVIISDCNLKISYQEEWKKRGIENSYRVETENFPITLEEAWKNDMRRGDRAVGRDVLIQQYQKWLRLTKYRRYFPNLKNPKAIVCDIDGTIALATNRNIYDYSKVLNDKPREKIVELIRIWANAKNYKIIFVSGRDMSCFEDTSWWITHHVNFNNFDLYMRKDGDYRKDRLIKEEIFWNFIADRYNVVAVFDDRPQVVRMWHDIGIENVINVQQGYHEF